MGQDMEVKDQTELLESDQNDKNGCSSERQKKNKVSLVGSIDVFRFADCLDIVLMLVGAVGAIAHGVALPLSCLLFGDMTNSFVGNAKMNTIDSNTTIHRNSTLQQDMTRYAIYFSIGAFVVLLAAYLQVAFWCISASRQATRIRKLFFHSIMQQDISWFDVTETGELNTRLVDGIYKIQEGIGDKFSKIIQASSTLLAGLIIGFIKGWKLTLVILAVSPLLVLTSGLFSKVLTSFSAKEYTAYAKAGAVAEEVLSAIRTVFAFSGQDREIERYHKNLEAAKQMGVKKAVSTYVSQGLTLMVVYMIYSLCFWYGSTLILVGEYSIGTLLTVFFVMLLGVLIMGQTSPNLQTFHGARGAAYDVYNIIDHQSAIDNLSEAGFKPDSITGDIEFKNIHFSYPSRPDIPILNNLNLSVKSGQTMALVGSSGCGKSTTIQLLQRFYDPKEGSVTVDGHDIRSLNVRYLREMIGVVSQEPILFATTIAENIRYGRLDVTDSEIEQAAKESNAYDFIMNLPDKFETMVGDQGTQMSGGQKQRIAIARALVRNPKILLLDEATSALDAESETIVQAALDKVRLGRTTIVVAHRLSTIRNADVIAGFQNGKVVEMGTHSQLMEQQGIYHLLVTMQTFQKAEEWEDAECEVSEEKSLSVKSLSQSSLHRRKSRQGTSFAASEGEAEVKEKFNEDDVEEGKNLSPVSMHDLLRLNAKEWPYIFFGMIFALINGAITPSFSIILSHIIVVFANPDEAVVRQKANFYALMFLVIAIVTFIAMSLQGFCFGKSGEILTLRLRLGAFKAMMRQDLGWFDKPGNNVGALTTRLATETAEVQGATGLHMAMLARNIASMGVCLIISFVYGWELTLLILAMVPFIVLAGAVQMKVLTGHAAKDKKDLEISGKIASEAIKNIRTIVSLNREPKFESLYQENLVQPSKNAQKGAHVFGFTFSLSQAMLFFAYACCFRFGAWLIVAGRMDVQGVFLVVVATVFGSIALGETNSFGPSYAKAKVSASHIMHLINKEPAIDNLSHEGESPDQFDGNVHFDSVWFTYPTRPDMPILQGLDLKVSKGETLALVGTSGCGKSTTIQLLQRFYDPKDGRLLLDNKNTKDLNIFWLRSQIGIVSQEPVLFDCTLGENIAYGDNSRTVTLEEIQEAAKAANIHNFIEALPQKYDTQAGDKGAQLSGGQKQRIAIARAILRKPKMLLLDEATSALDTESEKIVQEALDQARKGRTCIIVAHRLSTIQNADRIAVFQGGVVVEQGTHQQLMAQNGVYHMLVTTQMGHGRE